jgi:hypothetical protein
MKSQFYTFKASLDTTIACPYCGEPNQLDPALLCCGEVHAQLFYVIGDELIDERDLMSHYGKLKNGLTYEAKADRADWVYDSFRDSED